MMKKIFVTATNTDIGKTYTVLKLMRSYAQKGYKVGALKPIETGVIDVPQDGLRLWRLARSLNPDFKHIDLETVVPIRFALAAAPFVAAEGKDFSLEPIYRSLQRLGEVCDVLFIEGAGGLYVPIHRTYYMIDLIADLHVDQTVLVTHCDLGCINDTILSKKALDDANLAARVIFNCKRTPNDFARISRPFFDAIGLDIETV